MILEALNSYYDRLSDDPALNMPPPGFGRQKIHFCLVINKEGRLLQVKDLREMGGKRPIPISLTVPQLNKKRTVGFEPNFGWDNTGYALGVDKKGKRARSLECFGAFRELQHKVGDHVRDEGMKALLEFLDTWDPEKVQELNHWDEMASMNIVFQLDGDRCYIHERPAIQAAWSRFSQDKDKDFVATCLVSGETGPIARLHPPIKGVNGSQTTGASIISFNLDAFESYGKDQNFNAPVSETAAFAYTTVLNHLLRFESRQKMQIGDATTVFWTARESPIEGFMGLILNPREDVGDLQPIRLFLEAVRDGKMPREFGDPEVPFFILGLSPNAARISVRFWHVSTVGDITEKIGQHFRDLSIVRRYESDLEFPGMWHLLRQTAVQGKTENISPLLAGALMRSLLMGAAYPQALLVSIIGRIRADQDINYLRASIIKACLVRKSRINRIGKEVNMALDKESTNVAYRLGRLFAVLEKVQLDAVPGANTTIKDRFYGSASSTPRVVFPQLLRLAQHHIQKAEYGRWTDRVIEEIMGGISEFPSHLSLDNQGLFAIGYYHQRQAFFTKSTNEKEG
jgi:CRISPR-associated protein Csd1